MTNADNAKNFKLVEVLDRATDKTLWNNLITMKSTEKIEDVDLFQVLKKKRKETTLIDNCCIEPCGYLWSPRLLAGHSML